MFLNDLIGTYSKGQSNYDEGHKRVRVEDGSI